MIADDIIVDPKRENQLRESGWWNDDTILTYLERHATLTPDKDALISDQSSITWSELLQKTLTVAGGLNAFGIQRGDVVATQLPNSIEFVSCYLACAVVGAIFQPVHLPYRGNDLQFLLDHSGAKAFVGLSGDSTFSPVTAVQEFDNQPICICIGSEREGSVPWTDIMAAEPFDLSTSLLDVSDPFLLLYTSGTTSSPKGVPHASNTILSGVRACADELEFTSSDRFLILSYYSHMWGITALTMALYSGASTILTPKFTPDIFGRALDAHDPTIVIGAPVHILKAEEQDIFDRFTSRSLKYIITSGSAFPDGTLIRVTKKLQPARILELWGMTEVAPICVTRPDSSIQEAMGTVGPNLAHSAVRVTDNNGDVLPAGSPGELQINASSVFGGYLRNPEANSASFCDDGWFSTGDIAVVDEGGVVRIKGRIKEVINRGGVKFSVTDVEKTISAHEAVLMCSIVPVPDSILGERACCVVEVQGNRKLQLDDVCAYLAENGVEKTKWPEFLVVVDNIPMTPTGKAQREKVTELAITGVKENS